MMFFFKQKTAYEMRISDWSSDVCSSDLEHLDLAERVLTGRGVENEHNIVRRRRIEPPEYAADLGELDHQDFLVLQPARRIDDKDVDTFRGRLRHAVEDDGGRIAALGAGDDRHADAVGPDLELADGGGTEGVAGGEQHAVILLQTQVGELGDSGGLAGAVDAAEQAQHTARASDAIQRRCHRRHYLRQPLCSYCPPPEFPQR